jgi:hypothetical protein
VSGAWRRSRGRHGNVRDTGPEEAFVPIGEKPPPGSVAEEGVELGSNFAALEHGSTRPLKSLHNWIFTRPIFASAEDSSIPIAGIELYAM